MNILKHPFLFGLLLIVACKNDPATIVEETLTETEEEIPPLLPMTNLALTDLSQFKTDGQNWQIAGEVYSDWQVTESLEVTAGNRMLINKPTEGEKGNIMTTWEHGDLDLEIDFLVPKGSNSGIYLQGRYELQILDSWGKETATSGDCGGIYQRWEESQPEGKKGFEGTAPKVNASKAPGLWQNFKIAFQAPRFDDKGQKIKNAILKKVYHNGFLIHDNVELTGPTRGPLFSEEAATGPLFIQGDHGPVAFKNIKYKAYTLDKLTLTDLAYEFFDGKDDKLPDFSQLTATKTGELDSLHVKKASDQADGYRLRFTGKLEVPVAGDYLFTTMIDDGGELLIDGASVVLNEGDPGYGEERGVIHLTKGTHDFVQTYYQEVWGATLVVDYEGPGIIKQSLASEAPFHAWKQNQIPVVIEQPTAPEMIRSFVNHNGQKKTNILTIGDPAGVHYSYDLRNPNLIKAWKGKFADVSEMWRGRGEPQRLDPMNAAIDLTDGLPIANLSNENAAWPSFTPDGFKFKGYEIDDGNRPTFKYNFNTTQFTDHVLPSNDGKSLVRTITKSGTNTNLYLRIAAGKHIQLQPNGLYNVDGAYYIEAQNLLLRNNNELLAKIDQKVEYIIHW